MHPPMIKSCLVFCPCVFQSFYHCDYLPLGERAGLCAFRAFVCFARIVLCLFPFPLGVGNWLRLVIVALPGLFFLPNLSGNICTAPYKKKRVFAQTDQGLRCLLTETLDTTECINGEQMLGLDFTRALDESKSAFCACWKTPFRLVWPKWKWINPSNEHRTVIQRCVVV